MTKVKGNVVEIGHYEPTPKDVRGLKCKTLPSPTKETMAEKLEGSKTYEVPVKGGFNRMIQVNANSFKEATAKVETAGHSLDPYRWGKEK